MTSCPLKPHSIMPGYPGQYKYDKVHNLHVSLMYSSFISFSQHEDRCKDAQIYMAIALVTLKYSAKLEPHTTNKSKAILIPENCSDYPLSGLKHINECYCIPCHKLIPSHTCALKHYLKCIQHCTDY